MPARGETGSFLPPCKRPSPLSKERPSDVGDTLIRLEQNGLEIHDVEGWREHYQRTCTGPEALR